MEQGLHCQMGLTDGEYRRILELLGREPNRLELGMFSVMWSEHCSYKSSRRVLEKFPTQGPQVLQGPGENAGVVDIGGGWAVSFKIESHNHPSAIEPYQGAATGVGGIIRDIFSMGARPVALLNSLRFGSLESARVRYLVEGVVAGIGGYGNCVGIPTVGGEACFYPTYAGNPLVNAMCVGILPASSITRGTARGEGNAVMLAGARTGRDGLHGVTFASEELDEQSEEQRPAVQVGDPFTEKLLIESCLEVMERGLVVGVQDLGGAGLTCAASEMSSRAGGGMRLNLDRVHCREEDMDPYEIMLSESQERMLLVVEPAKEQQVREVFERWGLEINSIGEVVSGGMLELFMRGEKMACFPAKMLCEAAPSYDPPFEEPPWFRELKAEHPAELPVPGNLEEAFLKLMASPNIASKEWIFRQYDQQVRTCTAGLPGGDAAVIRLREVEPKGLALSVDGNSRYTYLDPYKGGMIAVVEAARNVAVTGARPLAITNCLNFGSPTRAHVFWQFRQAVEGMSRACEALGTPVTGGNVSFYNETSGEAIFPTPVVGMVGLLEDVRLHCPMGWRQDGELVCLVGDLAGSLAGSEFLHVYHGKLAGELLQPDLERARNLHLFLLEAIGEGLLSSAHDLSDGGLAVALAESSIAGGRGVELELLLPEGARVDELLFGEAQSRVVMSLAQEKEAALKEKAGRYGLPLHRLGITGGDVFSLKTDDRFSIRLSLHKLIHTWEEVLPWYMNRRAL